MSSIDKDFSGITDTMAFEFLLNKFLGKKAYGTAGSAMNIKYAKRYFISIIPTLKNRVSKLDADIRLKEILLLKIEQLERHLRELKINSQFGDLFVDVLTLVSYLLGYDFIDGEIYREPIYSQSLHQQEKTKNGRYADPIELMKLEKNLLKEKANLMLELSKKGLTHPEIGFVFNCSDYEVKKLLSYFKVKQ